MASHNILITGGSGYLGGSLLHEIAHNKFFETGAHKIFALVRTDAQASSVKNYGATPLTFNSQDEDAVREAVLANDVDIVFYLIDALQSTGQLHFIKALGDLKTKTGRVVHFLHTTGAKIFSSHADAPTDRVLFDDEAELYQVQKSQKASLPPMQIATATNNTIIETSEKHGVRCYIFAPCIVYGKGLGFGNKISIQTVAIVKASQAAQRMYKVDPGKPTWPVCHISDTVGLYLQILHSIIAPSLPFDSDKTSSSLLPPHGKQGYYLASSGSIVWEDLYSAIAKAMHARGVLQTDIVDSVPSTKELDLMAKGLACPREYVGLQIGGSCTFSARRGAQIGWQPRYPPEHAIESMDEEVALILDNVNIDSKM